MVNVFERNMKVDASLTDVNIQFGLLPALTVAQDNMCEYFRQIGCDGITMIPVKNCFFVLTKSKIKFDNFATWLDEFKVRTELTSKSKIRVSLQTDFDCNDKHLATCMHEMCAMDATERTLRAVNTTLMPEDLEETKDSAFAFEKMAFELTSEDMVGMHRVNVGNLDFYKHTNNLQYVHIMFSSLGLPFVENNVIDDFEIHYISETRNGDVVAIFKKVEEGQVLFQINNVDNKCVTKAVLKYHKK